jgi:hypothetical protein
MLSSFTLLELALIELVSIIVAVEVEEAAAGLVLRL